MNCRKPVQFDLLRAVQPRLHQRRHHVHPYHPPAVRAHERLAQTRRYRPNGDLRGMLEQILRDYAFSVPYCDLPGDLQRLQTQLCETLPDWSARTPS